MPTHWSDWLFWYAGWILAGVGALLLLWALIGDRSRGRRRCRKCWYDMGSIESVDGVWTCPECGKRAGREKLLDKPRRRWRWGAACLLIFPVAYGLWATPRIRVEGWPGVVPTTVAILGMGSLQPGVQEREAFENPRTILRLDDPRAKLYRSIRDNRIHHGMPAWQLDLLLWQARRAARGPSHSRWALCHSLLTNLPWIELTESPEWLARWESVVHMRFYTRSRWASGQEIRAHTQLSFLGTEPLNSYIFRLTISGTSEPVQTRSLDGLRSMIFSMHGAPTFGFDSQRIGRFDSPTETPRYQLSITRDSHDGTLVDLPVRELTLGTIVTQDQPDVPMPYEADLQAIVLPVDPHSVGVGPFGIFLDMASDPPFDPEVIAIAGNGEILCDGEVVHRFDFEYNGYGVDGTRHYLNLTMEPHALAPDCDGILTLRLTGDPLIAMRNLEATHFWNGVIEVPIE